MVLRYCTVHAQASPNSILAPIMKIHKHEEPLWMHPQNWTTMKLISYSLLEYPTATAVTPPELKMSAFGRQIIDTSSGAKCWPLWSWRHTSQWPCRSLCLVLHHNLKRDFGQTIESRVNQNLLGTCDLNYYHSDVVGIIIQHILI